MPSPTRSSKQAVVCAGRFAATSSDKLTVRKRPGGDDFGAVAEVDLDVKTGEAAVAALRKVELPSAADTASPSAGASAKPAGLQLNPPAKAAPPDKSR